MSSESSDMPEMAINKLGGVNSSGQNMNALTDRFPTAWDALMSCGIPRKLYEITRASNYNGARAAYMQFTGKEPPKKQEPCRLEHMNGKNDNPDCDCGTLWGCAKHDPLHYMGESKWSDD